MEKIYTQILAKKEMHAKFAIETRNECRICDKKQGGSLEGIRARLKQNIPAERHYLRYKKRGGVS